MLNCVHLMPHTMKQYRNYSNASLQNNQQSAQELNSTAESNRPTKIRWSMSQHSERLQQNATTAMQFGMSLLEIASWSDAQLRDCANGFSSSQMS